MARLQRMDGESLLVRVHVALNCSSSLLVVIVVGSACVQY